MKQKIHYRLQTLKSEFDAGQKTLIELEDKQTRLRETLLRISGAIQVLEELLNAEESEHSDTQLKEAHLSEPSSTQPIDVAAE